MENLFRELSARGTRPSSCRTGVRVLAGSWRSENLLPRARREIELGFL